MGILVRKDYNTTTRSSGVHSTTYGGASLHESDAFRVIYQMPGSMGMMRSPFSLLTATAFPDSRCGYLDIDVPAHSVVV
jgi:hypothetical protein